MFINGCLFVRAESRFTGTICLQKSDLQHGWVYLLVHENHFWALVKPHRLYFGRPELNEIVKPLQHFNFFFLTFILYLPERTVTFSVHELVDFFPSLNCTCSAQKHRHREREMCFLVLHPSCKQSDWDASSLNLCHHFKKTCKCSWFVRYHSATHWFDSLDRAIH